jgi:hypothetical protein
MADGNEVPDTTDDATGEPEMKVFFRDLERGE